MSELELLNEINENLKKLIALTATQDMPDDKKINTLQAMGFNSVQISRETGIPISTVKAKWKKTKAK